MNISDFTQPVSLKNIIIDDPFWKKEMELVRTEVIPYQWNALNDRIPGAAKSYCMRNFKLAGKLLKERKEGKNTPVFPTDQFETLPEDNVMEERAYGFLFQDSDFYKWVEAVSYSLTQHPDEALEKLADEAIETVCAAQRDDGYLDTFYIINDESRIFTNLRDHHELYCFGHLAEAAVAYYEATKKTPLLEAAKRYARFIAANIGPNTGQKHGYPGHEIAEMALMRLYDLTNDDAYLSLARYFIDERGKKPYYFDMEHHKVPAKDELRYTYHQAHLPVRDQEEAVGHAVRAVYLYSGMADASRASQDASLDNACKKLWDNIVHKKMYITGGIGATVHGEAFSFNYDLPNDTAYAETCAAIGLVFFARRMLQNHPDSQYADVMERALYNGILSGMALDGRSFFYVNPLEVLPEACHKDERKFHVKSVRQKWFGCACCPPNIARTVSSIGNYAFTEKSDALFVHLYIGAQLQLIHGQYGISLTSEFPWNGNISLIVNDDIPGDYTFALRLPGWCKNPEIRTDSNAFVTRKDGYAYFTKQWRKGDRICMDFPMTVTAMTANKNVREDVGRIALQRGPLVYCMEEIDNGPLLHLNQIALPLRAEAYQSEIKGCPAVFLKVKGFKETASDTGSNELYTEYTDEPQTPVTLTYVPYFMWNNRGEGEMQVWTRRA